MRPSLLQSVLSEALTHGKHSPECAFEISKRKGQFLPDRHPAKVVNVPDLNLCNCWRKKASRLLKAVREVKEGEVIENESKDFN